ncbi:hypothetical protein [Desulfobacter latus]|uniref:Uncharacterized protein n=1 Tax=Desulfobacter latus TaxID=2292 RepID=A0A850SZF4_9BACT|nr:hypothetical protein [Desulfobacter latus]NWH04803.1 hypothetical protein [Desulfobacter latus]
MKLTNTIMTAAALFLFTVSSAHADWCSGTHFGILRMERYERIEKASQAVDEEYNRLAEISNNLTHDIKHNIIALSEELDTKNDTLAQKTVELCRITKANNYSAIEYNGVTLAGEAEITAQLRMNLAAIQANEAIIIYLGDSKNEYQTLMIRVQEKLNEMAVLKKQYAKLLEPRSENRENNFEDIIANTCVAVDVSEKLRMSYVQSTRDKLFAKASETVKTRTISAQVVDNFKKSCDLSRKWTVGGSGLNK